METPSRGLLTPISPPALPKVPHLWSALLKEDVPPALRPLPMDVRIRRLEGIVANNPGGGTAVAVSPAFEVTITDAGGGLSDVAVNPGTINNILATNYSSTFSITTASTYYLVSNVTTADGKVTTHTLATDGSAPAGYAVTMGLPPTSFSVLIGIIIAGVWWRVIGSGSLVAESVEVYRTSKTAPAPGTLPYDIWYTWSLFT